MKRRLMSIFIVVVGIGLIISLSRDVWRLLKAGDQIRLAETKLRSLEEENQELERLKKYYQSDEFVEEEARNKLNMARPGEKVVILPPNIREIVGKVENVSGQEEQLPNWQRWWRLFF